MAARRTTRSQPNTLYLSRVLVVLVLIGVTALLLALAACGAEATPTPTPRPPTPTPISATPTPTARPATPTPTPVPATPTPVPPTATTRPGTTPVPATATPTLAPPTATPTRAPTATPAPRLPLPGLAPSGTMSDADWAKVVEAAKKEGKVMAYAYSFTSWQEPVVKKGFKEAYGIDVEIVSGTVPVLVERAKTETRAGAYIVDVMQGPSTVIVGQLDRTDFFRPILDLPELRRANDPGVWYSNPIFSKNLVLAWPTFDWPAGNYTTNTKIVPPEREPKKWPDLTDPWWKGKVCLIDPFSSSWGTMLFLRSWRGTNYSDSFLGDFYDVTNKGAGRIFFYLLGSPDPLPTGECGIRPIWNVGAGTTKNFIVYDKVTWAKIGAFDPAVPVQPATMSAAGVAAKAPHPNAALLFTNWLLKDGLVRYLNERGVASPLRKDVPDPVEKTYWPEKPVDAFWAYDPSWFYYEDYIFGRKSIFKLQREGITKEAWVKEVKDSAGMFWGQYPPPAPKLLSVSELMK